MIKLQDFAKQQGVTDRQIQRHLKKHEEALSGHFERKGSNGTWLDDYAQEYIRNLMKQQPMAVYETSEITRRLEAEYKALSQEHMAALKEINRLTKLEGQYELREAQIKLLEAEKADKDKSLSEAEERAQKANMEVEELKKQIEEMKNAGPLKRLRGWK